MSICSLSHLRGDFSQHTSNDGSTGSHDQGRQWWESDSWSLLINSRRKSWVGAVASLTPRHLLLQQGEDWSPPGSSRRAAVLASVYLIAWVMFLPFRASDATFSHLG